MLKLKNVLKTSLWHRIARFLSDIYHNNAFYRKVTYNGLENIEPNKPTLLGPNHQNALMDAAAILSSNSKNFPVFLARSDIFNPDFVGNLLIGMKILPVYRIRDGKDKLALNEKIFNVSVNVLEQNKTLVVFPEAQHTPYRSLISLKKGLMRIAFHIAEKHNFNIDLQIIPVGIYYKSYFYHRSELLVNFGKPIYIKDYKETYEENKNSALLALRNDMKNAMIPLAIHIKNKDFYQVYEDSRDIFDFNLSKKIKLDINNQVEKFKTDKKIISILDDFYDNENDKFQDFAEKISLYTSELKKNKIKDYLFDKPVSGSKNILTTILLILLLPINILGFINFAVPICLPELLVKKFKDAQFHSSVRYVVAFVLPFIWGLLGFILLWVFTKTWWIGFVFMAIQYPLMPLWFEIRKLFKKNIGKWRFIFLNSSKKEKIKQQRDGILEIFNNLDA